MTTFTCPHNCGKILELTDSIPVTPKNPLSQDELIQTLHCPACNLTCLGLYLESRAGAKEHVNHDGYIIEESSFNTLSNLITQAHIDESKRTELEKIYHAGFADSDIDVDWKSIFPLN